MNCKENQELLSAYIDLECTDQENKLVELHLNECSLCREEYDVLKGLIRMTNELEELDVPEGFHSDLMRKIHTMSSNQLSKKTPRFSYKYSMAASVFLFVIVFGILGSIISTKLDPTDKSESISDYGLTGNIAEDQAKDENENIIMSARGIEADNSMEIKEAKESVESESVTMEESSELTVEDKVYQDVDKTEKIKEEIHDEINEKDIFYKILKIIGFGAIILISIGILIAFISKKQ